MFDRLDLSLRTLLEDTRLAASFPELFNADVSFMTPEKSHAYKQETVNLFLYETRENRELRSVEPHVAAAGPGISVRRRPPLRVDCTYLVTTWSKHTGSAKVAAEHRLLGQVLNWLSRFPELPQTCIDAAGLTEQVFAPPTLVAQLDSAKNAGEFWTALAIPPRPCFNLVVTVAMDLALASEDSIVTTLSALYRSGDTGGDELVTIGGAVRDRSGDPVADAWVLLEPEGRAFITDALGRFVFERIRPGGGRFLRARAPGLGETPATAVTVPSPLGTYDLQF